jgi:hypothetical protein
MAIEGPLRELGIHDVFQLLDLSRKTGVLTVASTLRRNRGQVYFERGAIIYASIQTNPHPLGGLLVRTGRVAAADVRRARDMQRAGDGRRLGEILTAIGALTPGELERQVRSQVEEVVFEVMSWDEGHFSFVEGPLQDLSADATVRVPTSSLLMEGARRIDEWSRIEKTIPHVGVVPALAAPNGNDAPVDLHPLDWRVLALVDGERSIRTIAQQLGTSEFDTAKTVFGLAAAGLVALRAAHAPEEEASAERRSSGELLDEAAHALEAGDEERAWRRVEEVQKHDPDSPDVHVFLGELELRRGKAPAAEAALRRALRLDPMLTSAHRLLGEAVARQGRIGEAVDWWQRWLTVNDTLAEPEDDEVVRQAVHAALTLQTFLYE